MTKLRFWDKTKPGPGGCLIWTGSIDVHGRGRFRYQGRNAYAHRVAWILTHGHLPKGMHVCHRCDVPNCVNPDHLFLGTQLDNVRDMYNKGREPDRKGASNGRCRLNPSDVLEIRNSPLGHSELGRLYGVTPQAIYRIRTRKTWDHV